MKLQQIESEKVRALYFDSVDWELVKLANSLVKQLPERAEMVAYHACHAFERNGSESIEYSVGTWFTFTLDGWKIDFMPNYNWLFEGINLSAYQIIDGAYRTDCYPLTMQYDLENDNRDAFIELLLTPELLHSKQVRIVGGRTNKERESNQEYVSRKRKIEHTVYTL